MKDHPLTLEEFDKLMDKIIEGPNHIGIVYDTEEELEATKAKLRKLVKDNTLKDL